MATIVFIPAEADNNKGFRIGAPKSVFQPNVTFTVTGVKFGNYQVDGNATKYAGTSQAILFETSVGEDIPLNRLLHNRRVVYNEQELATIVWSFEHHDALRTHLETLGRRDEDSTMLKGTVKQVADKALEFFQGKTLICVDKSGFMRNDKGKLVAEITPTVQISFKD